MLPGKIVANKSIKRLERPRPLKWMNENLTTGGLQTASESFPASDDVLVELENLVKILNNANLDSSFPGNVQRVCRNLKGFGRAVESNNSAQLDRYFVFLRNAARDERLDPMTRLHLLEIIELRASGWKGNDLVENYYKNRLQDTENVDPTMEVSMPMSPLSTSSSVTNLSSLMMGAAGSPVNSLAFPTVGVGVANAPPPAVSVLATGEISKSSGKYPRPTKIPAKNYFKDEIIIRNSDSGKVMGIKGRRVHMIEELSGTIVSFQRVMQGAKDRLVQITGPSEESIGTAKQLIEDTIRRNVSPIREMGPALQTSESSPNLASMLRSISDDCGGMPSSAAGRAPLMHSFSMSDATIGEYQYTVNTGCGTISLSGKQFDILRTAKLVLEEYFAGDAKRTIHECIDEEQHESSPDFSDHRLRTVELPELMQPRTPPPFSHPSAFHVPPPSSSSSSASSFVRNGHPSAATGHRLPSLHKASRLTGRCPPSEERSRESTSDSDEDEDDDLEGRVLQRRPVIVEPAVTVSTVSSSGSRKVYTRHYLLRCSESVYSRVQPKDISRIVLDNPTIHKKTAEFFEPRDYYDARLSPSAVLSCNWPPNNGSQGSSQDVGDDE